MCVLANLEYLSILFCAVLWAAAPGLVAVLPMWDLANVSGTVTSHSPAIPMLSSGPWQESGPIIIIILKPSKRTLERKWRTAMMDKIV